MSNLINCFQKVAPFLNELTINDIGVAITDKEKYIDFIPGNKIPVTVQPGEKIPEGTVVKECMCQGKRVVKKVAAEIFGFPYIACGIPIIENNEIIGAVSFVLSIEKQEKVLLIAEELSTALTGVSKSSQFIGEESEKLVKVNEELSIITEKLNKYIKETDGILKLMENISRQTNLLGINASIEASRVGASGKGFEVVANEIRQLAKNTSDSITRIEDIFENMKDTSSNQGTIIEKINNIVLIQEEAIKSGNTGMQQLNSTIVTLIKDAEKLSEDE